MNHRKEENPTNNRGITLIALVITIIVLLILAGISIATLTDDNGIITKAQEAKEATERAQIEEQLKLAILSATIKKKGDPITIDDLLTELEAAQIEIDFDTQDGSLTIEGKYIYQITEKNGTIEYELLGTTEKLIPKIMIKENGITTTTSTIMIQVSTKRNDGGTLEFYIKEENETDYVLKKQQSAETYTYEGLAQNKTYHIKVKAIATNGETAEVTITCKTGTIPEANITFTYEPDLGSDEWTNGSIKVTATIANPELAQFFLKTSIDGGTTWQSESERTFTENGGMLARLYDGTNLGPVIASAMVDKIDTTEPNLFTPTATMEGLELKDASDEIKQKLKFGEATTNAGSGTIYVSSINYNNNTYGSSEMIAVDGQLHDISIYNDRIATGPGAEKRYKRIL